jgi:hypothetical protein
MGLHHLAAHQVQRRAGVSGGRCRYRSVDGSASNRVIRGSRVEARDSFRRRGGERPMDVPIPSAEEYDLSTLPKEV